MPQNPSTQSGILNLDKPKGITSFDLIRQLRRITGIKKIGHAGTLDPMATGVMIIAIGEGTKLIEYLMKSDKRYLATITFGAISDTYDAEGKIENTPNITPIEEQKIRSTIAANFQGKIDQIPPKYSALKINGTRACDLVRQGKEVEIKSRTVTIHEITIIEFQWPNLKLDIHCSSGTYIRSIAHDLGQLLSCGAYLSGLERTEITNFHLQDSHQLTETTSLNDIQSWLLPLSTATTKLAQINITETEYQKLSFGQFIKNTHQITTEAATFLDKTLVGIVEPVDNNQQLKFRKKLNTL